jgi:hypothetical protein
LGAVREKKRAGEGRTVGVERERERGRERNTRVVFGILLQF